jgi:hypothetical protein
MHRKEIKGIKSSELHQPYDHILGVGWIWDTEEHLHSPPLSSKKTLFIYRMKTLSIVNITISIKKVKNWK